MKHVIFYDKKLPFDGQRPSEAELKTLASFGTLVDGASLAQALNGINGQGSLVWLQGSYLDASLWPSVMSHLGSGGGLVVLGKNPLSRVLDSNQNYQQSAYFRQLHIHEILEVDASQGRGIELGERFKLLDLDLSGLQTQAPTSGFVLMPTKHNDQPGQLGSSGPMDMFAYPVANSVDKDGVPIASPVVCLENMRGGFEGGRWIFITQEPGAQFFAKNAGLIEKLADFAGIGVTELRIEPVFSTYYEHEVASFKIHTQALKKRSLSPWTVSIEVVDDKGGRVFAHSAKHVVELASNRLLVACDKSYKPGYYLVKFEAKSDLGDRVYINQGFWVHDAALLAHGQRLAAGEDYFVRGSTIVPIVGMTYMAPTVHRKYLELPNANDWDKDFAYFKKIGITYVRTGIWNSWRQYMFIDGEMREAPLRAIDAMVHVASKYEIELCFNFFAFTPDLWEGANPYLDPRSIAAQKRFIAEVVRRYAKASFVHFDLINEPSTFDPNKLFRGPRGLHDSFENEAFRNWLKSRNPELSYWRTRWDKTIRQLSDLAQVVTPHEDDIGFETTEGRVKEHGIWLDFTLFTQDAYTNWAKEMSDHIKSMVPEAMVTTGQDEGMSVQRPNNLFFGRVLDYTNIHTWWLNDAMSWDLVVTKLGRKPNVVQETGIMHVESPNGRSKRTEWELSTMLERKYAYSFVSGSAGAVQWIWNINYHMDNNNESHIGALRADGSHKPEAFVSKDFGEFFKAFAPFMKKRKLEEVAILYPFSNDFGPRRTALTSTQNAVRALHYNLKIPLRSVNEYDTSSLKSTPPRLLIVPSPQVLCATARSAMAEYVKAGGTLLISGPVNLDEYWYPVDGENELIKNGGHTNQMREERLKIGNKSYRVNTHYDLGIRSFKGLAQDGKSNELVIEKLGKGKILWSPLSVELASNDDARIALYEKAIEEARVAKSVVIDGNVEAGVLIEKQSFAEASLWILVSEDGEDKKLRFSDADTGVHYSLVVPSERAVLFATDSSGRVIVALRNHEIHADGKE